MYLKRHAFQPLVAERSARQRKSKAKLVHYNEYQCFHFSSGLCLFVLPYILTDSPCTGLELDTIIITQLTSKKGFRQAWHIFMTSSGCLGNEFCWSQEIQQLRMRISGSTSRSQAVPGDLYWLSGFRWKQNSERFLLFLTMSCLSSILRETSLRILSVRLHPNTPRHLTLRHITSSTHMRACCVMSR